MCLERELPFCRVKQILASRIGSASSQLQLQRVPISRNREISVLFSELHVCFVCNLLQLFRRQSFLVHRMLKQDDSFFYKHKASFFSLCFTVTIATRDPFSLSWEKWARIGCALLRGNSSTPCKDSAQSALSKCLPNKKRKHQFISSLSLFVCSKYLRAEQVE